MNQVPMLSGDLNEEVKQGPQPLTKHLSLQRTTETKTISLIADQIWNEPLNLPGEPLSSLEM